MTQYSLTADQRMSWLPSVPLISAKLLDLRKRRTLLIVTVAFTGSGSWIAATAKGR